MNKLEKLINEILVSIDPEATFTLWGHELWRDAEGGWSSNDRWKILSNGDLSEALEAARSRWEVMQCNYGRHNICDIQAGEVYDGRLSLDVNCLPYLDIEVHPAKWEVIVGNVGYCYVGTNYAEAKDVYDEYREQSISETGRAGGENVTLTANGEPFKEFTLRDYYTGTLARAYQKCWAHHPRGGRETGYATKIKRGLYSDERGISMTEEGARNGQCFTSVPVVQVLKISE